MNKTFAWLIAAALTLTLLSDANAQNGKQRTGKVVRIKGDARYSTGNKIWQPLKVGAVLQSGAVVQTAANSFVDIVLNEEAKASATVSMVALPTSAAAASASSGGGGGGGLPAPDQDVIRVLDDTYLVFDSLSATPTGADTVTETLLDLKKGTIFAAVKKQAAASRFEVKIPNGVAGIRGTYTLISASGRVACLAGSVVVAFTSPSGDVEAPVIGALQEINITNGQQGALSASVRRMMEILAGNTSYSSVGRGPTQTGHSQDHNFEYDFVSRSAP